MEYGANGALQSFGGTAGLNTEGESKYGGQSKDSDQGTIIYDNMERYAIAIGPLLQNPNCDLYDFDAGDMAYGTCVDISIELNGETHYIPAIIVDTKGHLAPTGVFQTGVPFSKDGAYVDTGKEGPIVEWYVVQGENEKINHGD